MDINRVIKMRLYVNSDQATKLSFMLEQYRQACQLISQYIFDHGFELNSNTLSRLLYHQIREQFGLKAQLTSSTFKTVTARYLTVQTQLRQHPYRTFDGTSWQSIPKDLTWLQYPIRFRRPQADLVRNRDYAITGDQLSLQTLDKRIKVDYTTKGFDQYLADGWQLGTAKLLRVGDKWFLHVAISKTMPDFDVHQAAKHVVGIDRGLRFLATTFDERQHTMFIDGKSILRKRAYYNKRRQALQALGTKAAKRKLKQLSGQENRWMTDVNHRLSKTLVNYYGPNTVFTLENLTGVSFNRDDLPKALRHSNRSWSFYQFEQFLTYKAEGMNSAVVSVSAQYTSQRCPRCGVIRKDNRDHDLHEYHCQNCGYRSNDDRIGAINIQQLGTRYVSGITRPKFERNTSLNA